MPACIAADLKAQTLSSFDQLIVLDIICETLSRDFVVQAYVLRCVLVAQNGLRKHKGQALPRDLVIDGFISPAAPVFGANYSINPAGIILWIVHAAGILSMAAF